MASFLVLFKTFPKLPPHSSPASRLVLGAPSCGGLGRGWRRSTGRPLTSLSLPFPLCVAWSVASEDKEQRAVGEPRARRACLDSLRSPAQRCSLAGLLLTGQPAAPAEPGQAAWGRGPGARGEVQRVERCVMPGTLPVASGALSPGSRQGNQWRSAHHLNQSRPDIPFFSLLLLQTYLTTRFFFLCPGINKHPGLLRGMASEGPP